MANQWIEHVKKVAAEKGISYREALKVASASYSKKGAPSKTHPGEMDYTTKKGDVVFHEKGKYVKKARKPYMKKVKGGEVKPFLAEGEGPIWDAVLNGIRKLKRAMEHLDIVQNITDLVGKVLDEDASTADKVAEGRKVFVKFATGAVLAAMASYGMTDPLTIWIAKKVVPLVAGGLYDLIARKISGGAKVKSVKPYLRQLKKELASLTVHE